MSEIQYKLSAQKVEDLRSELIQLQTKGRKEIFDSLVWLRDLPSSQEDETFSDVFEDKKFLEKRIAEIEEILANVEVLEESTESSIVELGSHVRVGVDKYEQEFVIVTALEADPINGKISDESPVGKSLLGHSVGDVVIVDTGLIKKQYRILSIK